MTSRGALTTAAINDVPNLAGDIDGHGCDIGDYINTNLSVSSLTVHDANQFGILVDSSLGPITVTITGTTVYNIGAHSLIEHCFTTMHTGKAPWEVVLESIRRVGPERCLLSTDLGQTINPPVAEGFAMFAQTLLDAGFSVEEIRRMSVTNPSSLIE